MYEIFDLDEEQLQSLLGVQESYLTDLKAKQIKPSKLTETVSAFANASGGDIYVGISEAHGKNAREWDGFQDPEEANDIAHTIFASHPFGNHVKLQFLRALGMPGLVLQVSVRKVKDLVRSSSGEVYVRVNAGKQKVETAEKLRRLELDKGIVTFESEWVEITPRTLETSDSIKLFVSSVIPRSDPFSYLKSQALIKEGYARVCGVLLFCDEPAVYLPKRCSVKVMRYHTKQDEADREFLDGDPVTIEGDAYSLIFRALDATKRILKDVRRLGELGWESVSYPDETLHEIVTNAVLHRDYSISADTQIRVFDNRIEVESPGRLPGHVTVANILETQNARNPSLVRLINKFPNPPNKDVGEGLNTAFRAMEMQRLKPPWIIETDNSVLVVIRHEYLGSPEDIVMKFMAEHDEITNWMAREITGIRSENTMKSVLLRLKMRGLLEPVPERKGAASAWRKPGGR